MVGGLELEGEIDPATDAVLLALDRPRRQRAGFSSAGNRS
jgi:hypothetical protein